MHARKAALTLHNMATFTTDELKQKYSVPTTSSAPTGEKKRFTQEELSAKYSAPMAVQKEAPKQDGFLKSLAKDVAKTLVVKPVARATELVGRTGLLGEKIKTGYEEMSKAGEGQRILGMDVEAQKSLGEGGGKQILGDIAKTGSYLYGGGAAPSAVKATLAGKIGQGALLGAKTGAVSGGLYEGGEALQEDASLGDVASRTLQGAVIGGAAGGAFGGVLPVTGKVLDLALPKRRTEKVLGQIRSDVDELFTANKAISNAEQLALRKNVPLRDVLSDPTIFKGIKVENQSVVPDEAIETIADRLDIAMDAKGKLLPEIDAVTMPVPRDVLRQKAYDSVRGQYTPADEQDILKAIDKQINALPEKLKPSEIDAFRARARKSSRDAKGLQKSTSEYTALENAARDTVFEMTDNLPFDTNKEYPALNNYIKNLIEVQTFLDKTLRGKKVKGGRLGTYTGKIIGAIAGSQGGVLGSIAGSELGGAIANILSNAQLGNSLKMSLIKNMTDDPAIIKAVQDLLQKAQKYNPLDVKALPAGATRLPPTQSKQFTPAEMAENAALQNARIQNATLRLPAGSPDRVSGATIGLRAPASIEKGVQRPLISNMSRQNTANTTPTMTASVSIPKTLPKPQKKSISVVETEEFINPVNNKPWDITKIPHDWASYTTAKKEQYLRALEAWKKLKNIQ